MDKKVISSGVKPVGPYSPAILKNETLYISGQICLDSSTGELNNKDISTETKQVLTNLNDILKAANMNSSNIVKCTIFLSNMDDFAEVNSIYSDFFENGIYPARETVEVSKLPKNVNVEISAIAIK